MSYTSRREEFMKALDDYLDSRDAKRAAEHLDNPEVLSIEQDKLDEAHRNLFAVLDSLIEEPITEHERDKHNGV